MPFLFGQPQIPGFGTTATAAPAHPGRPRRAFGLPKRTAPAPKIEALADPSGLLDYQVEPAKRLAAAVRCYGGAIDCSDTGTGKTYQVLAAARDLGISPLVVCPKAVIPSWHRVAEHLGVELLGVVNYEKIRTGNTEWGHWSGPGKRFFRWDAANTPLVVWDEAHYTRNETSQNSRMLVGARRDRVKNIVLSATMAETPLHLKAAGFALGLHNGVDFREWTKDFGCGKSYETGRWEFSGGIADLRKLHNLLFPHRGVRVRREDLGDAFPETQVTAELFQLDRAGRLAAIYQELANTYGQQADEAETALVAQLRLRQELELLKVPLIASLARDAVAEGQHVAIFVNFTPPLEALCKLLGTDCCIHGGQSPDVRQKNIDAFQSDRSPVIVCNLVAGGVGIGLHDTHGRHPRLSLICPTFSAVQLRQALGRVHRAGSLSKSIQRIVLVAGGVEEHIQKKLKSKLKRLDSINDGDLTP